MEIVIQLLKEIQLIIDVQNVEEADFSNMEPKIVIQKMKLMMDIIMLMNQKNGLLVTNLMENVQNSETTQIQIV